MTKEEKEKAIDALKISAPVMAMTQEEFNDYIQTLNKVIDWLEQEPKTGRWIKYCMPRCGEQHYQCTSCEYYINFGQWGEVYTKQFKYCPNCGAKMKGGE